MAQTEIILGEHKFQTSRLRTRADGGSYRVSANRSKMLIFFAEPEQVIKIEGAANVAAALQELEFALDDGDEGWS